MLTAPLFLAVLVWPRTGTLDPRPAARPRGRRRRCARVGDSAARRERGSRRLPDGARLAGRRRLLRRRDVVDHTAGESRGAGDPELVRLAVGTVSVRRRDAGARGCRRGAPRLARLAGARPVRDRVRPVRHLPSPLPRDGDDAIRAAAHRPGRTARRDRHRCARPQGAHLCRRDGCCRVAGDDGAGGAGVRARRQPGVPCVRRAAARHPSPASAGCSRVGVGCHVRDSRARDARLAAARRGVAARPPRHAGSPCRSRPRVARARRALAGGARRARALCRRPAAHRSGAVRSACEDARGIRALDRSGAAIPRRHPARKCRRLLNAAARLDARQGVGADRGSGRRHGPRRTGALRPAQHRLDSRPRVGRRSSCSADGRWAARRLPG